MVTAFAILAMFYIHSAKYQPTKYNNYHIAESVLVIFDEDLQARDSREQRDAGLSDPQAKALQAPTPRIGFHRSLYTPYILAYIFAKDSV